MKNVRKISKKYYVRQIVACWLVYSMLLLPVQVAFANIGDGGYDVVRGTADVTGGGVNNALIDLITDRAVINWQDFDTSPGQLAEFVRSAGGNFAVLNRVIGAGGATQFYGNLKALAGDVFIINTRGIVFGPDSFIQARTLVASGIDMLNDDFMNSVYQFQRNVENPYGDWIGDVENLGPDSIVAERMAALIGNNVTNRGHVAGEYVIMAAGESVLITGDPVNSNVVVEVTMPEQTPGNYDHKVNNYGKIGDYHNRVDVDVDHVILAAGDIWSAAIEGVETLRAEAKGNVVFDGDIHAEAGPGSDAVADVTIITGGDFTVEGYTIKAEADAEGALDTDAIATVSITADGDVKVNADGTFTSALIEAKAENGEKNEARVNIESTNGHVAVESEGVYEWAVIRAEAEDGIENIADITIEADGDVKVTNQGGFFFIIPDLDWALIEALAHEGTTNTAAVDIDAGGNVEVVSNEFSLGALIKAEAKNKIELEPDIPPPVEEVVVDLDTIQGLVNTATVDITADGYVDVAANVSGFASVKAKAYNDLELDIDNGDNELVTVNLTVADLQNNAGVTITAEGEGVHVGVDGTLAKAGVSAEAYNELEIDQDPRRGDYAPATVNLTVTGLENNANVDVTATNGSVEVGTDEHWFASEAGIYAGAWNDFDIDLSEGSTGNLTFDGIANNAGIGITADEDVLVMAADGGEAGIAAEAYNELDADDEAEGTILADNITNDAGVVIDAVEGNVEVAAECEGDCSEAYITAEAWNDVPEPDEEPANIANNADVDIAAGEDVKVIAKDCGDAQISALAEMGTHNSANVTITADNGKVLVHGIGGKYSQRHGFTPSSASIEAEAINGENNTAGVTITANADDCDDCENGDVKVIAVDGGKAEIEAIAKNSSSNTADVAIDADGEVKVIARGYGSGPESEAEIMALAKNDIEILPSQIDGDALTLEGLENTASIDITALNVEVTGQDRGEAEIEAIAKNDVFIDSEQSGEFNLTVQDIENTAGVTITAVGDVTADFDTGNVWVTAEEGGKAKIGVEAENEFYDQSNYTVNLTVEGPVENTAKVVINADDDVEVTANLEGSRSIAEIEVKAENEIGDIGNTVYLTVAGPIENTAGIDITAADNVLVKAEDGGVASIEAKAENDIETSGGGEITEVGLLENTANVKIDAEGSVKVIALGRGSGPRSIAEIEAEAQEGTENTADVTIDAGCNVEVIAEDSGDATIAAEASDAGDSENFASVTITTDDGYVLVHSIGEVDDETSSAEIEAIAKDAYGDDSENKAEVTITTNGENGDVQVIAEDGGEAEILALAKDAVDNKANVKIDADGDVQVIAKGWGSGPDSEAAIEAKAKDADNDNTADIEITAGGNVEVIAGSDEEERDSRGQASIEAEATNDDEENKANVTINAGGNVEVIAYDEGEAVIKAEAEDGAENTADIKITANDGHVMVYAIGEDNDEPSKAEIEAIAKDADTENTANVTITAKGENGDVKVIAEDGGEAEIMALAKNAYNQDQQNGNGNGNGNGDADAENSANITINADGDVQVMAEGWGSGPDSSAQIEAKANQADSENNADITINAGGDVKVTGKDRGEASIEAAAECADNENAADITITATNVEVTAEEGGEAKIEAEAEDAHDEEDGENNADVTITATGDVKVIATGSGSDDSHAEIEAAAEEGHNNNADVTITATNVDVTAEEGGEAEIDAQAEEGHNNTANITITATGDVKVIATGSDNGDTQAEIEAEVDDGTNNTAGITINAGGDVEVRGEDSGEAEITAAAGEDEDADYADAAITINAKNVTVTGDDDEAEIGTYADADISADATVDITLTGSDLTVGDEGSIYAYARTYGPEAWLGDPENGPETRDATAEVTILADGQVTVEEDGQIYSEATVYIRYYDVEGEGDPVLIPGDATATTTINAKEGVTVEGSGCEDGEIYADASISYNFWYSGGPPYVVEGYRPDAIANVDIQTCGDVIVDGQIWSYAEIYDTSDKSYPKDLFGDTTADVIVKALGDVIVNSEVDQENGITPDLVQGYGNGSNGQIEAWANGGLNNSAGITVFAVGNVIVNNGSMRGHPGPFIDSQEEIRAAASGDAGSTNNAFVHIATRDAIDDEIDDEVVMSGQVIVSGQIGARTWIEGQGGSSNTSSVEISAAQDVIVNGGYALHQFEGPPVYTEEGGQIMAGAMNGSFNTANVDVYAGRDVIVHGAEIEYMEPGPPPGPPTGLELDTIIGPYYYDGGQILAITRGDGGRQNGDLAENTSSIGIYAQRDVTIHDAVVGEPPVMDGVKLANNNDGYADGQILAGAHGLQAINDADVVICAQEDVTVDGEIGAEAGTDKNPLNEHYADIKISAGGLITGTGYIYAEADPEADVAEASIVLRALAGNIVIPINGDHFSVMDEDNPAGDGLPDIEIGPVDCPECDFEWIDWTWCVDCEEFVLPATPTAPLPLLPLLTIQGCPVEMEAAATELGITRETIQVTIGDALALNPSIQPCQACASLIDAAAILRDDDGSRMAAMNAVFGELAPADAPFTPEMSTAIATAFEGAAEGTQYATAVEYIDAFVQYIAVLDTELGSPVGDSVAFVMEKHGTGITDSANANIAAFVAARIEALGG